MDEFVDPVVGSSPDPGRAVVSTSRAERFPPYPAEKLERELAAFDLADAAQAATRAASLSDQGEAAESDRFDLLSQRLYDRADAHRRNAEQAHSSTFNDNSRGETPGEDRGHRARPPRALSC